jgi:hypothetical protein
MEENVNYCKGVSANEGVNADNETEKTSNLSLPPQDEEPSEVIWQGPLTFDPLPPTEEGEDIQLAAANNQAELMRWHYKLGHLSFPKLKQLTFNGEIPKKLAKIIPPQCTGCLFGAMTKLPWQGKETKASHKVFIATKPGECVSVHQMISTEVGFYTQLKREAYQEVVQGCHHICQPLQPPTFHPPPTLYIIIRNNGHQDCL